MSNEALPSIITAAGLSQASTAEEKIADFFTNSSNADYFTVTDYITPTTYELGASSTDLIKKKIVNGVGCVINIKTTTGTTDLSPLRNVLEFIYNNNQWDINTPLYNTYKWFPSTQLGVCITADSVSSYGTHVVLSKDSTFLAVSCVSDASSYGEIKTYTRSGSTWTAQTTIAGFTGTITGVALSLDHTILVAITSDKKFYTYQYSDSTWSQLGSTVSIATHISDVGTTSSVALSANGLTVAIGSPESGTNVGAVAILTRSGSTWSKQGSTLVGTGNTGASRQGISTALSADGNTLVVGGHTDNSNIGAVWVFLRTGSSWTQQGSKLVGSGYTGSAIYMGFDVSVSSDGNTLLVGGYGDNTGVGSAWVFIRIATTWYQQGNKLVASDYTGAGGQGESVSLSQDGNTAVLTASGDNSNAGAIWTFTCVNESWYQKNTKLVPTDDTVTVDNVGNSCSMSSDGGMIVVGTDNPSAGNGFVSFFS